MKHPVQITLFSLLLCSSAFATTVGGIELPAFRDGLRLNGAGVLRKGFFFKIYVGALYVADTNHVVEILTDVPKRIDIHYFHHTPKKHMIRVADETLKNNLDPDAYKKMLPRIGTLHSAFRDGRNGSVASIIHKPGTGLVYSFDGDTVITVPGDDFANAYFSIWLGRNPSSKSIKRAMLNRESI